MRSVNVHQAKTTLSELLVAVETRGELVVICRNGRPIAELRRIAPARDRLATHPALREVVLHEDPTLPLPELDWSELR